jgi:hypothetical protein
MFATAVLAVARVSVGSLLQSSDEFITLAPTKAPLEAAEMKLHNLSHGIRMMPECRPRSSRSINGPIGRAI